MLGAGGRCLVPLCTLCHNVGNICLCACGAPFPVVHCMEGGWARLSFNCLGVLPLSSTLPSSSHTAMALCPCQYLVTRRAQQATRPRWGGGPHTGWPEYFGVCRTGWLWHFVGGLRLRYRWAEEPVQRKARRGRAEEGSQSDNGGGGLSPPRKIGWALNSSVFSRRVSGGCARVPHRRQDPLPRDPVLGT